MFKQGIGRFLRELLLEPTSRGYVQFFRYGLVAIIAFGFDFGLLYLFTSVFQWFYLISATLAFTISVIVNYLLSTAWVFAQRTKRERSIELTLFIGICLIAVLLNDLFMWIFTSQMGIYYLTSKLMSVVIVFFWSFGARRFVFHTDFLNQEWVRKILQQTAPPNK